MSKLLNEYPSVCIAIAAYNVEDYIEKTVKSVLDQTYNNIHVIVINDGSTDGTLEQLNKFKDKITIYNQENNGLSSVRNKAIELCKEDYLVQIDGDDYVERNWISNCIKKMVASKSDLLFFGYNSVNLKGNTLRHGIKREYSSNERISKSIVLYKIATNQMNNYTWSYILKASIVKKMQQPVFPLGIKFEDMATTYKFILNAKKIDFLGGIYYHYVQRSDSITKSPSRSDVYDLQKIKKELNSKLSGIISNNILETWNLNINIACYQILSYSKNENAKFLEKLKNEIISENCSDITMTMKVKIKLIKLGIYKYVYSYIAKLRWKI